MNMIACFFARRLRLIPALLLLLPGIAWAAPPQVFVSISPLDTFVERISDGRIQARTMVRPGHSPATYDPTPQQITALAQTDLYIRAGVPFERAWMQRIRAANSDMAVLDASEGLALRTMEAHGHHDDHGHSHLDPHVWTSPRLVIRIAEKIAQRLIRLDPANADAYRAGQRRFVGELNALDREITVRLKPFRNRAFMIFHPAWGYFADAYGLRQIAIEHEGKSPGARALAGLIDQAKEQNIRTVFVQPQFPVRHAQRVAEAIGGRVIVADPLADDYIANLRRVSRHFAQALQP